MPEQPTELLTADQVADWFQHTKPALYVQRHRGEAPGALSVKIGKRLLWRRSDLEAWVESVFNAAQDGDPE